MAQPGQPDRDVHGAAAHVRHRLAASTHHFVDQSLTNHCQHGPTLRSRRNHATYGFQKGRTRKEASACGFPRFAERPSRTGQRRHEESHG